MGHHLTHLPPSLLAEIFSYLPALNILQLVEISGDRLLNYKAHHGGIVWLHLGDAVLRKSRLDYWTNFKSLQCLSIDLSKIDIAVDLSSFPSSLRKLCIHGSCARWLSAKADESFFSHHSNLMFHDCGKSAFNFRHHYPNLRHLELQCVHRDDLHQKDNVGLRLVLLITRLLPPHLETLAISHLQYIPSSIWSHFPINVELTQLPEEENLFLLDKASSLPTLPNLNNFAAIRSFNGSWARVEHPYGSAFARRSHFQRSSPPSKVQFDLDRRTTFPSYLTVIWMDFSWKHSWTQSLPRTLKVLSIRGFQLPFIDEIFASNLPQGLTSLSYIGFCVDFRVQMMPKSLTNLCFSPLAITTPATLRPSHDGPFHLEMPTRAYLRRFHDGSLTLDNDHFRPWDDRQSMHSRIPSSLLWTIKELPPALTSLAYNIDLSRRSAGNFVHQLGIESLPNLTRLECNDWQQSGFFRLKPLIVGAAEASTPTSTSVYQGDNDPPFVRYTRLARTLMPSLTHLIIIPHQYSATPSPNAFAELVFPPSLTHLTVHGLPHFFIPLQLVHQLKIIEGHIRSIETQFYSLVSSPNEATIIPLSLHTYCGSLIKPAKVHPMDSPGWDSRWVPVSMPSSLTSLELCSSASQFSTLQDMLQKLPNLTHFSFKRCHQPLDMEDIDFSSTSLSSLELGSLRLSNFIKYRKGLFDGDYVVNGSLNLGEAVVDLVNKECSPLRIHIGARAPKPSSRLSMQDFRGITGGIAGPQASYGPTIQLKSVLFGEFVGSHRALQTSPPVIASNLTSLTIGLGFTLAARFGKCLPPTLTFLDVMDALGVGSATPRTLPSSLTELYIESVEFSGMNYAELPRGIIKLKLTAGKFKPLQVRRLPPKLEELTIEGYTLLAYNAFRHLPASVSRLVVPDIPENVFYALPATLSSLTIVSCSQKQYAFPTFAKGLLDFCVLAYETDRPISEASKSHNWNFGFNERIEDRADNLKAVIVE